MKCMICGCVEQCACQHPDAGPCSWHSSGHINIVTELCSHCADPEIFLEASRPLRNLRNITPLTPAIIGKAFKAMGLSVSISLKHGRLGGYAIFLRGVWSESLHSENVQEYHAIVKAWFPFAERLADVSYNVFLDQTRPQLERDYPQYLKQA